MASPARGHHRIFRWLNHPRRLVRLSPGQRRRFILVIGNTIVTSGAIVLQVSARGNLVVWTLALIAVSLITGILAIGTEWLIVEGAGAAAESGRHRWPDPGVANGSAPVSLELPPADEQFVGRRQQLDQLRVMLQRVANDGRGAPVLALYGMGGVGKSSLAVQFAEEVRSDYPGGVLHLSLGAGATGLDAPDPATALGRLLSALGVRTGEVPPEEEARRRLYHDRLVGRRVLVVLDDAKSAAQVRPLLARVRGCATVITSRRPLGLLEAEPFTVGGLDDDSLRELLVRQVGARRVDDEPDAARQIIRACGGLPLALRLVAARLAADEHRTLAELADRLSLEEFRSGDVRVRDAIEVSYADLSPRSRRAFRLLTLFPSISLREWAPAPLLDIPVAEASAVMEDLVEAQLLERAGRGVPNGAEYRFHALVREYAEERLAAEETPDERRSALARLGGAFLTLAEYAEHLTDPTVPRHGRAGGVLPSSAEHWHVDDPDLLRYAEYAPTRWLLGDCRRLGRMVERVHEQQLWDLCWEISVVLARVLETVYTVWNRWDGVLRAGLDAATRRGDRRAESIIHQGFGVLRHYQDRFDEAEQHFTVALRLCREIGHRPGEAYTLRWIGRGHYFAGHFAAAVHDLEQALELSRELGNKLAEARVLRDLCEAYAGLRRFTDAEQAIRAALALFESDAVDQGVDQNVRQPAEAARARRDLGILLNRRYKFAEAEQQLTSAVDTLTELGHWYWRASAVFDLAMLRLRQHRPVEAEALMWQSFDTFNDSGYRYWTAVVGRRLAMLRMEQGRVEEAVELMMPVLETFQQLGLGLWESYTLRVLAWVRREEGRLDVADQHLEDAAALAERYEDPWGLMRVRWMQASVWMAQGRAAEAVRLYREAAATAARYEEPWQEAEILADLAKALRATGDRAAASRAEAEAKEAAASFEPQPARRRAGSVRSIRLPVGRRERLRR
ncbi:ATP-binding protein [Catenulispora pinisilvae]|uniref:ATP-binding protein n=1 Tax=Catenulispora pinisilvae TaxID=2705253 RepID=UPI001890F2A5|nr:tetratricopeptide repeat protein [Catenulispora pinisilvae]